MTPGIIAFFMAAGASAWVYNKTQERTGNNTASSLKLAGMVAIMAFIITLTVLSITGSYLDK